MASEREGTNSSGSADSSQQTDGEDKSKKEDKN